MVWAGGEEEWEENGSMRMRVIIAKLSIDTPTFSHEPPRSASIRCAYCLADRPRAVPRCDGCGARVVIERA